MVEGVSVLVNVMLHLMSVMRIINIYLLHPMRCNCHEKGGVFDPIYEVYLYMYRRVENCNKCYYGQIKHFTHYLNIISTKPVVWRCYSLRFRCYHL